MKTYRQPVSPTINTTSPEPSPSQRCKLCMSFLKVMIAIWGCHYPGPALPGSTEFQYELRQVCTGCLRNDGAPADEILLIIEVVALQSKAEFWLVIEQRSIQRSISRQDEAAGLAERHDILAGI